MYARRRHVHFAMMGACVGLFVLAGGVVRLWSVPAAVGMCLVAMVIPPVAAMVANRRGPEDRWWDDPSGDPESDAWWDELNGRKRPRWSGPLSRRAPGPRRSGTPARRPARRRCARPR